MDYSSTKRFGHMHTCSTDISMTEGKYTSVLLSRSVLLVLENIFNKFQDCMKRQLLYNKSTTKALFSINVIFLQ